MNPILRVAVCLLVVAAGVALAQPSTVLLPLTQSWRFTTNNLDGVDWRSPGYDEAGWSNSGSGLFYIEDAALPAPTNTALPGRADGGPLPAYYFRAGFNVPNAAAVGSLTFSNLIDDGAVFYLNGVEVRRVGMSSNPVAYSSLASRTVGDATVFDVFHLTGDGMTNLITGGNVLAVEVHQWSAGSSDVVFGAALIANARVKVTRGPYLQSGTPTSVVARWRTDIGAAGWVRFGTNPDCLNLTAGETSLTNEHQVALTGLRPDTKYYYSIGNGVVTLAGGDTNHFFVTSPVAGAPKPTRIWVIGDSGTADGNQVRVRNAYEAFTGGRHTDLWLMLGDNAYSSGTDFEYQRAVFNIYTNLLRKSVLWPTLGNHDTSGGTAFVDAYPYFKIFTLPRNGEAGGFASGTEHYYSFDHANIHFICLDSMTAGRATNSAMYAWLTNDLANITADWTIAYWHHPPYTKGSHNSDTENELIQMRRVFLPVLEDAGVDLILAGHSHSYERSYLLDRHYGFAAAFSQTNKLDAGSGRESESGAYLKRAGDPIAHLGTVYAVVGCSGKTSGGALNHPAMFVSLNRLGSMVLDINGDRLDATFLRENGATNDFFTILKTNEPPSPPILVSPPDAARRTARYPALKVGVADPDANLLRVTFYGQTVGPRTSHFSSSRRDGGFDGDSHDRPDDDFHDKDGWRWDDFPSFRLKEAEEEKDHRPGFACVPPATNTFAVIGRFSGVPSGGDVSLVWTNLQPSTTHRWFVTVSDGKHTTTGPVWRFTTDRNFRPVARHLTETAPADAATELQLAGHDHNGDPLTYAINDPPERGLISRFDPANGSFTYTPARGFAGRDHFTFHVNDGLADSVPAAVRLRVKVAVDGEVDGLTDSPRRPRVLLDSQLDPDGDGMTNLAEYQANTDPNDAGSALRIVSARREARGSFTFTWAAVGGTRYRVSFSEGDARGGFGGTFSEVIRPVEEEMNPAPVGSPTFQSFTDDFSATGSAPGVARYYRVRVVQ
jgi:hypothetical protein